MREPDRARDTMRNERENTWNDLSGRLLPGRPEPRLFSSMIVVFVLLLYPLPFLALFWLILAVTYPWAKNREVRGRWLLYLGIAIGVAAFLGWQGYEARRFERDRSMGYFANQNMRKISYALEWYYVDNNVYPPAVDLEGKIIPCRFDGSSVSVGYVPWLLTTPIPYLSWQSSMQELPSDPFHLLPDGGEAPFRYATNGLGCWIMTSNGRDRTPDVRIEDYPVQGKGDCTIKKFIRDYTKDGVVDYYWWQSSLVMDDIIRVGPD